MEELDNTVTEHPEAIEARLVELERARQELTSMMAHDMLNLLHGIVGFFNLVENGSLTPQSPEFVEFMTMANQASRELTLLITSVLDVYRVEDGRLPLNRRPINLAELSAQSAEHMNALSSHNGVHLILDISPELPLLDVDEELIVRVLSNLLLRAIKTTPVGGQIGVTATVRHGPPTMVQVSVFDTGKSIAAEELERVFDRFRRTRQGGRATGLGLTLCKLIVELHGGRIWAESVPGRGSAFHFTLPVASDTSSS